MLNLGQNSLWCLMAVLCSGQWSWPSGLYGLILAYPNFTFCLRYFLSGKRSYWDYNAGGSQSVWLPGLTAGFRILKMGGFCTSSRSLTWWSEGGQVAFPAFELWLASLKGLLVSHACSGHWGPLVWVPRMCSTWKYDFCVVRSKRL
jgi:hypothetical protein